MALDCGGAGVGAYKIETQAPVATFTTGMLMLQTVN